MRDKKVGGRTSVERNAEVAAPVPGRQSLVQQSISPSAFDVKPRAATEPTGPAPELPSYASILRLFGGGSVQAKGGATGAPDVHAAAAQGISGSAGQLPHLEQIQRSFGKHDVSHVQAHTGPEAKAGAQAMGADAFATGDHVAFAGAPSLHIAAHEAAHVVQQKGGVQLAGGVGAVGDAYEQHADQIADLVVRGESAEALLDQHAGGGATAAVQRAVVQRDEAGEHAKTGAMARNPVDGKDTTIIDHFPWLGRITGTSSAALRGAPHKDPSDPHRTTIADLPRDTWVDVYGVAGGWYHVKVTLNGKELDGWVSHELVAWVHEIDHDDLRKMPTFRESLVLLKRAQTDTQQGKKIAKREQDRIDKAVEIVSRDPKYAVDATNYEVTFAKLAAGKKIQVVSIEDFILFVEDVERQYAGAKPADIAAEVRQLWFSDVNWDVLVDSDGVRDGGKAVDIETEPNPIASKFDMKDLAPAAGGKQIATRLGTVDIGHVMAGIDAALSGGPSAYPAARLQRRGENNGKSKFKWETLKAADSGNPQAFATWAGDLGQAYAVFISDVVVDGKTGTLADYVAAKAKPEEILGDIHGYIAVQVWKDTTSAEDPGARLSVSSILRDLYLQAKPGGTGDDGTYRAKFEKVSGKAGKELENFLWSEAFAFAEPWYVKYSLDQSYAGALDGYDELVREFNVAAGQHEERNGNKNTLRGLVHDLLRKAEGTLDGTYTPI